MDEVEKSQKETVKLLKSIKTLDDLKEHKDAVLTQIEEVFKAALRLLEGLSEKDIPPEEKAKEIAKFQDEGYLFNKEIEQEMKRIDSLPGAIEYIDSFQDEMDRRIQPHLDEIAEKLSQIVDSMMGKVMDEFGGMMEGMMAGIGLIIGGLSMTGVAISFSSELVNLVGQNVILLLMVGALVSFILGMGMTISACYVFLAIVLIPALTPFGFDAMAIHLFVLYCGLFSFITPPTFFPAFATLPFRCFAPTFTSP